MRAPVRHPQSHHRRGHTSLRLATTMATSAAPGGVWGQGTPSTLEWELWISPGSVAPGRTS